MASTSTDRAAPEMVNISFEALDELLGRMQQRLPAEDFEVAKLVFDSYVRVTKMVREQGATIARLRRLIGTTSSEKTTAVFAGSGQGAADAPDASTSSPDAGDGESTPTTDEAGEATGKKKRKGHGRVPVDGYPNATHIAVEHDERLCPGQTCPDCARGKLHRLKEPAQFLRIFGQAPLVAVCWDCQRVRCGACGKVFVAPPPVEALGPSADVGDIYMSLIHSAELNAVNPFDYLTALMRNAKAVAAAPDDWLPWNYRATLAADEHVRVLPTIAAAPPAELLLN